MKQELILAVLVSRQGSDAAAQAGMPGIKTGIDMALKCNAQYNHPVYQLVLANLYGAAALYEAGKQAEAFKEDPMHNPDANAIGAYLKPGETYYGQAAAYITPSEARPFLDNAREVLQAANQLYQLDLRNNQ
jgi:hypothetical protein